MKNNRVHYTWEHATKTPNCFSPVLIGYKPQQKASILLLGMLLGLFCKLKTRD